MRVHHIRCPRLPQYRFEWHEQARRLYLVRLGVEPEVGEIVAFDVDTHGAAINAVLIWCRGYDEGRRPAVPKLHLAI